MNQNTATNDNTAANENSASTADVAGLRAQPSRRPWQPLWSPASPHRVSGTGSRLRTLRRRRWPV
jgi:hypothetical protein